MPVPSGLIGKSCGTAATTLNSSNFKVKSVAQNSNTIASGLVISTQPTAGQKYQQGNTVKVFCSAGVKQTVVPSLQGLSAAEAGAKLQAAHLRVGNQTTVASATVKAGLVAYTAPAGGTPQPWGSVVTLYISGGQETATVPTDLVGATLQQAQKELNALQLYNAVHYQPITNPSEDGYVVSVRPKPGSDVKQNSTVTLFIGEYTGPTTTTTVATTTTATTAPATTTTAAHHYCGYDHDGRYHDDRSYDHDSSDDDLGGDHHRCQHTTTAATTTTAASASVTPVTNTTMPPAGPPGTAAIGTGG